MTYICPVCGYDGLEDSSDEICSCCGFQINYTDLDLGYTQSEWRKKWIESGMKWRVSECRPIDWDPTAQLARVLGGSSPD